MEAKGKPGFVSQVRALVWPFWVANLMEMIERFAYYGVRVVIPLYIAQADEIGGLHFTQMDKGFIFLWWALVQSILPVFTGGFADRYGYKNQIRVAIVLKTIGYLMMATQREFWPFFAGCMMLAAGTAVFKPPVQATFTRTLNDQNSGVGWGFFYMVVNLGGFLGPPLAHYLYGFSWPMVFYGCAALVSLNFIMLHTYKEVDSGSKKEGSVWDVVKLTGRNIIKPKLLAFILIMSGFWAGFTQLFDVMPNYIVDWVDSSSLARHLPDFMLKSTKDAAGNSILDLARGPQVDQAWMINLNPLMILTLVVVLSWLVNKYMRRLTSIFFGMAISAVALMIVPQSMAWSVCILGIVCFSLGEMLASPKMNEYLAVIAPPDQKALYMGYANIPFAIGWGYGAWYGGKIYGEVGEKATLALKYMREVLHVPEGQLPKPGVAFDTLTTQLGSNAQDVTTLLWDKYDPGQVWYPFAYFIIAAALALVVYNHFAKRWGAEANA